MTTTSNPVPSSALPPLKLFVIAIVLIVLWGSAFTLISVGVTYMSPIWLVAFRCIFAAVLVTAYAYWCGHRFPCLSDARWGWYFALAMTGIVVPFFFTATGQQTVDGGISAILVGAMPLMTIILAHFFADEPLTWRKCIGFAIGFGGIILLFLPENMSVGLISDWKAQTLLLLAALCYAVTTVAAKRAPETASSLGAAMMTSCAAIASLIWALTTGVPETPIPSQGWLIIAGLSIGSTALGTILYLYVVSEAGPTVLARINYFPPVAAVVCGYIFLEEEFTLRIAAAFLVILIGVIISRTKKSGSEAFETNLAPDVQSRTRE